MSNEKNYCRRENALDRVVDADIRSLETVLAEYRSIRTKNDLKLDDLIKGNKALKTNLDLVREASLRTKDLDNKEDIESHIKAKEALLLWCTIYCERVLMTRYSKTERSQENIFYGVKQGVMYNYKNMRNRLSKYFESPKNERGSMYEALKHYSVKDFMLSCANWKTLTEFGKEKDVTEIDILGSELSKADIIKYYDQKGITVFEGKDGKLYYNRYVAGTFTNRETGESFDNPDLVDIVIEIESEAQKLMDKQTIIYEMRRVIAYMVQSGEIDDLEEEFIRDVLCGDAKAADKEREWMDKGINISQTIGNYQRSILSKMQKVMLRKKEWAELADLVQRRKK